MSEVCIVPKWWIDRLMVADGGEAIELVSQLQGGAIDVEPYPAVGDDD